MGNLYLLYKMATLFYIAAATALRTPPSHSSRFSRELSSRRTLLSNMLGGASMLLESAPALALLSRESVEEKQRGLSAERLADIVRQDLTARQFLVTGDITRTVYSEDCTFQDEIDTYTISKWIKGTKVGLIHTCCCTQAIARISLHSFMALR